MALPKKTADCPCGQTLNVPVIEYEFSGKDEYDVCGVECHECGSRSDGGNGITGEVSGWMSAKEIDQCEAWSRATQTDIDNNEFFGRGEW